MAGVHAPRADGGAGVGRVGNGFAAPPWAVPAVFNTGSCWAFTDPGLCIERTRADQTRLSICLGELFNALKC